MGGLLRGKMSFHDPDPKTGNNPVDWVSDDGTVSLKGTTIKQTLHGDAQIVSHAGGNHILRLHKYDRTNKNRIEGKCIVVTQEASGTRSYGSEIWTGGKFVGRTTLDVPSLGSISIADHFLGRQWYTHFVSLCTFLFAHDIHGWYVGLRPLHTSTLNNDKCVAKTPTYHVQLIYTTTIMIYAVYGVKTSIYPLTLAVTYGTD